MLAQNTSSIPYHRDSIPNSKKEGGAASHCRMVRCHRYEQLKKGHKRVGMCPPFRVLPSLLTPPPTPPTPGARGDGQVRLDGGGEQREILSYCLSFYIYVCILSRVMYFFTEVQAFPVGRFELGQLKTVANLEVGKK